MAKAIFAGKKVKELALSNCFAIVAALYAIFPWFAKNLFVGYGPGNAGYGNSQYK
jgi:hypothetical protein